MPATPFRGSPSPVPDHAPQLLDVTLRDGGYVNDCRFPIQDAVDIVRTLAEAGIPRIEVGYFRPRLAEAAASTGAELLGSRCCHQEYLDALAEVRGDAELVAMVHLTDVSLDDYAFLVDHGVTWVRFVVKTAGAPELGDHVEAAKARGLSTSVNLIRLSERSVQGIVQGAREAESMGADWIYTADSNGSMFPHRVAEIFRALKSEVQVPLGYHPHDSLRLSFANSLAALEAGAELLDSSLGGMGKGAGNLVTELITSYLKATYGEGYAVTPLIDLSQRTLSRWISSDNLHRCQSALAALLDLNVDDLKEVEASADRHGWSLYAELDETIRQRSRTRLGHSQTG